MRSLRCSSAATRVWSTPSWAASSALGVPPQPQSIAAARPVAIVGRSIIELRNLASAILAPRAGMGIDERPRRFGHLVEDAIAARPAALQHAIAVIGRVEPVQHGARQRADERLEQLPLG